jgi:hypothetical protein
MLATDTIAGGKTIFEEGILHLEIGTETEIGIVETETETEQHGIGNETETEVQGLGLPVLNMTETVADLTGIEYQTGEALTHIAIPGIDGILDRIHPRDEVCLAYVILLSFNSH